MNINKYDIVELTDGRIGEIVNCYGYGMGFMICALPYISSNMNKFPIIEREKINKVIKKHKTKEIYVSQNKMKKCFMEFIKILVSNEMNQIEAKAVFGEIEKHFILLSPIEPISNIADTLLEEWEKSKIKIKKGNKMNINKYDIIELADGRIGEITKCYGCGTGFMVNISPYCDSNINDAPIIGQEEIKRIIKKHKPEKSNESYVSKNKIEKSFKEFINVLIENEMNKTEAEEVFDEIEKYFIFLSSVAPINNIAEKLPKEWV